MLSEITIENVAVIEKASATFGAGFNVLTGETGAGKSILIDSINAILGNRTSRELVRTGAAKASIWATFQDIGSETRKKLEAFGYSAEDDLLLNREVSSEGKSTCRINGAPATAAVMREVCDGLIQIHGQHDTHSLLDPARHLGLLDLYAQDAEALAAYRKDYEKMTSLRKEMQALQMDEGEKSRKTDLLRYEIDEIDTAALQEGEEEELLERRNVVRNAQAILDALRAAHDALAGDEENDGAAVPLGFASREMEAVASLDETLSGFSETVNELYYSASELASDIQATIENYAFDGQDLDALESRLDRLYRLKQKYGGSVESIIAYGEKAKKELETIKFSSERLEQARREYEKALASIEGKANTLTEIRLASFKRMNEEMGRGLDFLNMPGIEMSLDHTIGEYGPDGQDKLAFLICTNPGEKPKPLAKIASGGELARIMLTLKSALAQRDELATVIYDEIDTGISGMAAGRIGQMLRSTAEGGRQVICVTHTAQVAAYASQHLYIEKRTQDGKTTTHITPLDHTGRVEELARIISGDHVSDIALANAEEMIRSAYEN